MAGAEYQEMGFGQIISDGLGKPCGRALANNLGVYRGQRHHGGRRQFRGADRPEADNPGVARQTRLLPAHCAYTGAAKKNQAIQLRSPD